MHLQVDRGADAGGEVGDSAAVAGSTPDPARAVVREEILADVLGGKLVGDRRVVERAAGDGAAVAPAAVAVREERAPVAGFDVVPFGRGQP